VAGGALGSLTTRPPAKAARQRSSGESAPARARQRRRAAERRRRQAPYIRAGCDGARAEPPAGRRRAAGGRRIEPALPAEAPDAPRRGPRGRLRACRPPHPEVRLRPLQLGRPGQARLRLERPGALPMRAHGQRGRRELCGLRDAWPRGTPPRVRPVPLRGQLALTRAPRTLP